MLKNYLQPYNVFYESIVKQVPRTERQTHRSAPTHSKRIPTTPNPYAPYPRLWADNAESPEPGLQASAETARQPHDWPDQQFDMPVKDQPRHRAGR